MTQKSAENMWPYIGIISCLFVLSLSAPLAWQAPEPLPVQQPFVQSEVLSFDSQPAIFPMDPPALSDKAIVQVAVDTTLTVPFRNDGTSPKLGSTFLSDINAILEPFAASPRPVIAQQIEIPRAPTTSKQPYVDDESVDPPPEPLTVASEWPEPPRLLRKLSRLIESEESRAWSEEVIGQLDILHQVPSFASEKANAPLLALAHLAEDAQVRGTKMDSSGNRSRLLRTAYALSRRVAVWQQIYQIESQSIEAVSPEGTAPSVVAASRAVRAYLARTGRSGPWGKYFRLDKIEQVFADPTSSREERRLLAQETLAKTKSSDLTAAQYTAMQAEPFVALVAQLRLWAVGTVDYSKLLEAIENFEVSPSAADGKVVASAWNDLRWSEHSGTKELARVLNEHYRNANVRIAVAGWLINRLMPQPKPLSEAVNDHVLGPPVEGHSTTTSQLFLRLLPDQRRWRMGLEVNGRVASETAAFSGPVTLYNQGESTFLARKLVIVDRRGVRVASAEAAARSSSSLQGVESQYDPIPIIRSLIRNYARSQHEASEADAALEVEEKVAQRARRVLDNEVHNYLVKTEQRLQKQVVNPLRKLDLRPAALDLRTTEHRLIARCRLAGDGQLAAHTARPRARADSVFSAQIHESMLNNTVDQLNLSGEKHELRALYKQIATTFDRPFARVPEDLPEDVTIEFGDKDPVQFDLVEGQVLVNVAVKELNNGRRKWKNFNVVAVYKPQIDGLHADLVREGSLQLSGPRMKLGDRISLSGIFNKVFSREAPLNLVNDRMINDPRFEGMKVTLLEIVDGWLGIAINAPESRHALGVRRNPLR